MRADAKILAIVAYLGLAFAGLQVSGQTAREPEDRPAGTATLVSEQKPQVATEKANSEKVTADEVPPINYVRDKDGRLIPLLGFSWEDLQELLQQRQREKTGAEVQKPFDLQQLVLTGEATESRVELTATYKIRTDDGKPIEIPLVAGGAVLTEPASYEGPGQQQVSFDATKGAYFVRITGAPGKTHTLTIKFFAPLKNVGGQRRLEMDLPSAAASKASIKVPLDNVSVTANTGTLAVEVSRVSKGVSEINAWGLGGPLSLEWKKGAGKVAASTSRLVADGQIKATLDNRSVNFDVSLSVRSLAEEFDRFQIKLPSATKFVVGEAVTNGYTLSGGMDDNRIVVVQLWQKTKGPVEVKFQAERNYDSKNSSDLLELAAFEVVEAIPHRQRGYVAVLVSSDLQTTFEKSDQVRQVEDLPANLPQNGALAFEYLGQPASLAVKVAPRKTNISVEPEYVFQVEADRILLEAKLKYIVRGAKAYELNVEIPGWIPDEVTSNQAIDSLYWSGDGPLHLKQGVTGKFELTISAHRWRARDSGPLELVMPIPHADRVQDALVAVVPANNIRLRPNDSELVGFNRIASAGNLTLPQREQTPLIYRTDRSEAKFIATTERLAQAVRATAEGTLNVGHDSISITQVFQFSVEHEPLEEIVLDIPKEVRTPEPQFTLGDSPITPIVTPATDSESDTFAVRIPLTPPRSGTFGIGVKYLRPMGKLDLESGDPVSVPLVTPHGVSVASNALAISHEAAISVWPYDDRWGFREDIVTDTADNGAPALHLSAKEALPDVLLTVGREQRRSTGNTVVDRAWVQTWLGGGVRQDRAAYHIMTPDEQVSITLPEGASLDHVELKVDGRLETARLDSKRTVIVRFQQQDSAGHVVELRYQFADRGTDFGKIVAELPQFADAVWLQHSYWQLVLPNNRHLIQVADQLTPEYTWQWNGVCWERRSAREQHDLETWIGVKHDTELPQATNRYLFSMAGSPKELSVWSVGRGELMLVASLIVLVFGLALIYVPFFRRPVSLFAIGLAIAGLAVWQVEPAMLLLQSALVGCILVLLAAALEYFQSQRATPTIVRSAGSSIIESRSETRFGRSVDAASPASTESLPVEFELPAAESSNR